MLTDFGLSFIEFGPCSVKKLKDTLRAMAWRAPEFAKMTVETPTRKSDMYSLGMCIIEAVTGKNPWSGYSDEEISHFLRKGEIKVERPDTMTDAQWELVQQTIKVNPDERPDVADVLPELERLTADEEYPYYTARYSRGPKDRIGYSRLKVAASFWNRNVNDVQSILSPCA